MRFAIVLMSICLTVVGVSVFSEAGLDEPVVEVYKSPT